MLAAIENMAVTPAKKKMLILGDMFELGEVSGLEHQRIVKFLEKRVPDAQVVLTGDHFSRTVEGENFIRMHNADEVRSWLEKNKPQDTLILIKGSRGMKMETAAAVL